jgi:hypothetical protein
VRSSRSRESYISYYRDGMRKTWSHLMIVLTLAGYFLGNTHAGQAIAMHFQCLPQEGESKHGSKPATEETPIEDKQPTQNKQQDECSDCPHCKKRAQAAAETSSNALAGLRGSKKPGVADRSRGSGSSDCPCCPGEPHEPSCPGPGGCALCSVAKIPCIAVGLLMTMPTTCTGQCAVDLAFLYVPPCSSGLIRPPRA